MVAEGNGARESVLARYLQPVAELSYATSPTFLPLYCLTKPV